jgi:hypothetical protein
MDNSLVTHAGHSESTNVQVDSLSEKASSDGQLLADNVFCLKVTMEDTLQKVVRMETSLEHVGALESRVALLERQGESLEVKVRKLQRLIPKVTELESRATTSTNLPGTRTLESATSCDIDDGRQFPNPDDLHKSIEGFLDISTADALSELKSYMDQEVAAKIEGRVSSRTVPRPRANMNRLATPRPDSSCEDGVEPWSARTSEAAEWVSHNKRLEDRLASLEKILDALAESQARGLDQSAISPNGGDGTAPPWASMTLEEPFEDNAKGTAETIGKPATTDKQQQLQDLQKEAETMRQHDIDHVGKHSKHSGHASQHGVREVLDIVEDEIKEMEEEVKEEALKEEEEAAFKSDIVDVHVDCSYDRPFEQSIWDGLNFFALPGMSPAFSTFIALGLLVTIFTQITFCAAILKGGTANSAFLSDQFPHLTDIQTWRIHSGHYNMFLDELSGKTLTERVCDSDASLPFSDDYRHLWNSLDSYLSDGIGVALCSAALFVWALTIVQSMTPVLSGTVAVFYTDHHHSTRIGKSIDPKFDYRIASFTKMRAFGMALVCLIRAGVVVITGVTGGLWLANTKDLSDLILNSSALGLILSVDSLVYFSFLPTRLQALIENAEPMKLPDHLFGGTLYTLVNVMVVVAYTLLIVFTNVWPDKKTLEEKQEALCAGNTQFVYTLHGGTSTMYAASTHGVEERIVRDFRSAVTALIHSPRDSLASPVVAITHSPAKVTLVHGANMRSYTKAFESYHPSCSDTTEDTDKTRTAQELTGVGSNSSCVDWQGLCGRMHGGLIRLLCPITCGCADPLIGLMYRVESEGCAVARCQETTSYKTTMNSLECRDHTQAELQSSAGWQQYFDHLLTYAWRERLPKVQEIAADMKQQGCAGIAGARSHHTLHFSFCESEEASATRPGMGSLRAWCPVTCQCSALPPWHSADCPRKCYNDTNIPASWLL